MTQTQPDHAASAAAEQDVRAARYERWKLIATGVDLAISLAAPLAFFLLSGSTALRDLATGVSSNRLLALLVYLVVAGAALTLLSLPIDFFSGHVLEKRFNLTKQQAAGWLLDWLKMLAVQALFGVAAVVALYGAIWASSGLWWLIVAAGFSLFAIVLSSLAPVLLFPLFFKYEPLPDGELRDRLIRLSERVGARVRGVYVWRLGDKTVKANAALAGWGRTRRILLADTLIAGQTTDEIEAVLAHELAHHVHGDIWRGIGLSTLLTFAAFYTLYAALNTLTGPAGLTDAGDIAGLPLVALVGLGLALVALPVVNGYSRRIEHQADVFALEQTGMGEQFASAMEKLSATNLSKRRPNRLVQLIFHSHPSPESRIEFARAWQNARRPPTAQ